MFVVMFIILTLRLMNGVDEDENSDINTAAIKVLNLRWMRCPDSAALSV